MLPKDLPFNSLNGFYKVAFLLPLFFVLLAIFFKIQEKIAISNQVTMVKVVPTAIPTITVAPTEVKVKLDLNGPLICNYSDKTASVSAYIKNKNIYVNLTRDNKQNILVKGDCAYRWEPTKKTGDSMCGVTTYLSAFEMFSSFGFGNTVSLLSQLPLPGMEPGSDVLLMNAMKSCKKEEVKDTVFTIPAGVVFKTVVMPTMGM